jgi:hypothetical protein
MIMEHMIIKVSRGSKDIFLNALGYIYGVENKKMSSLTNETGTFKLSIPKEYVKKTNGVFRYYVWSWGEAQFRLNGNFVELELQELNMTILDQLLYELKKVS